MKHIKALDVPEAELGTVVAECGSVVKWGRWETGTTYREEMFQGVAPSNYCPECQREWVRQNTFRVRVQDPPKASS